MIGIVYVLNGPSLNLIDSIDEARSKVSGIVINPGGLTHTSIASMDAFSASELPIAEVHLSNIHRRDLRPLPAGPCTGHRGDGPADRTAQLTEQS